MKLLIIAPVLLFSHLALADCDIAKSPKNLSLNELSTHYTCIRDQLVEGYQKGGNPIAKEYVTWKAAATGPGKPGLHGNRYLMTYVNEIGHGTYVKYATENVVMPIGSVVAKESYKIKKGGALKAGPLFIMEKVALEQSPKTNGWVYSVVTKEGSDKKTSQSFCHSCHNAYSAQDAMGYPVSEVRFK